MPKYVSQYRENGDLQWIYFMFSHSRRILATSRYISSALRLAPRIFTHANTPIGLLSGFNCQRFDCVPATVKAAESTQTGYAYDELPSATRPGGFGAAIQQFVLQRNHAPVSQYDTIHTQYTHTVRTHSRSGKVCATMRCCCCRFC